MWVGSSGWSYPSWRPDFYPAGLAPEEFLSFYAERLPSVELNSTGYRLPSEEQFARWAEQVPDGFRFAVKMPPRALRSLGTFEERVRRLGDRLGPVRVVVESPRDDGLLALLLGSTGAPARARPARPELGRRRGRAGGARERLGGGRRRSAISASASRPTPRSELEALADRIKPLLAAGIEVFAYFQHEDAPNAPEYAKRLLELIRA